MYRYLPVWLADTVASQVAGALNAAAAQGMLNPLEPHEVVETSPAAQLTSEGWGLWKRLPLYGVLEVHGQEHIEWTSYWDGLPCVTLADGLVPKLLLRVQRCTPQHLWAQRHFGRHAQSIHGIGDPEAAVMEMVEGSELLEAAPEERVTLEGGLWKVVWAPAEEPLRELLGDGAQAVPGSFVRVVEGAVEIEPRELVRWELPALVVPSTLELLESLGIALTDAQTPVSVVPCFDSEKPLVTAGKAPGGPQATVLAPQPPDYWTTERIDELLAFVATL